MCVYQLSSNSFFRSIHMQIENDEERANDLNGKICVCGWNHLSNKEMNHKKVLMLLLYIIYIILPHAHDVMLLLQCLPKINKKHK